jgi:hypothetical protein
MDVTLPNGTIIRGVPDDTTKWAIADKAISGGLAKPEDFGLQSTNPTEGMSGFERARAGYGKAAVDLGRGIGQKLGLVSTKSIASSRERDAPLMDTTAGKIGNIVGSVVDTAPVAFIPGANTMAGAAAIGAGLGLAQPATSLKEGAINTGVGAAAGPASLLAARGMGVLWNAGKSLVDPLFAGGQDRIAARALQSFAGGPEKAAQAAANIEGNSASALAGARPTTAQVADNAGIAQLERSLRNNPQLLAKFQDADDATRAAMIGAVDKIAGTEGQRAVDAGLRADFSKPLYEAAADAKIAPDAALRSLLQRPSMKDAWQRASRLAAERGETLGWQSPEPPADISSYSGRALQYLKMALGDMTNTAPQQGIGSHEQGALKATLGKLQDWITENAPELRAADSMYRWGSQPVNQGEIGAALRDKLVPALADMGPSSRLNAASYTSALRNGDDLVASTLGRKGLGLADVMAPDQMNTLNAVGKQLAQRANAQDLGRSVGSNTAQNIVSQNVLRQTLGPLGLPQGWLEKAASSTLGKTLLRPVQFAGSIGEHGVLDRLAEASLDPKVAAEMLRRDPRDAIAALLMASQRPAVALGAAAPRVLPNASQQ